MSKIVCCAECDLGHDCRWRRLAIYYERDLKFIRRANLGGNLTLRRLADGSLLGGERIRATGKATGRKPSKLSK
ncbi:hypothetical protein LCGC14_2589880 [marine sediment metagenome]|uniref:Uncharacterized protein n=1 Tax=marine sediment metagenome TaxID=412755 RepID=A0A0F9AZU2_9ZZZZ